MTRGMGVDQMDMPVIRKINQDSDIVSLLICLALLLVYLIKVFFLFLFAYSYQCGRIDLFH